jgi:acyl-CoA synthetase (AMP-forming)/AMP-acid ligase II
MILTRPERIEQMVAAGYWGTRTLWDMFLGNVEQRPEQEAVVDPPNRGTFTDGAPRRLNWAELFAEVEQLAALLHQHGMRRDDVLIVQLPNGVEQVAVYLACHRLGMVISPLPVAYREHEIGHALSVTGARGIFTAARIGKHAHGLMMQQLADQSATVEKLFVWGQQQIPGSVDVCSAHCAASQIAAMRVYAASIRLCADDVVSICWTSGTESEPKGVPRSSNEWFWQSKGTVDSAGVGPGTRMLNPFPLVNMGGMSSGFVGWLLKGATLIQHHPFDLPVFLQQIRDERIEYTVVPPALLNLLLANESLLAGIDFQRLKRIGSGSAPLSAQMIEAFATRHGVEILNYFGSNEGAAACANAADVPVAGDRAVLFPRPQVAGRAPWSLTINNIVDTRLVAPDTGEEIVAAGAVGEMRIAGPTVFSGYYRAEDITASSFDELGYFRTGDLFEITGSEGQYLRFVGRLKDIIIRGGINISAEEIEQLVSSHPSVAEAAVVGFADAVLGEKLCACVVLRAGSTLQLPELVQFLQTEKKVAAFKLPERLLLLDALPRNPVGKVLKRSLRAQVADIQGES